MVSLLLSGCLLRLGSVSIYASANPSRKSGSPATVSGQRCLSFPHGPSAQSAQLNW